MRTFKTFCIMLTSANIFAQGIPVSHTPENKNVVLEEYTGIHCTYCPDGHKRAAQIAANNPGDVVLINIHSGGYAEPNVGEPDFRTSDGDYLDDQSGLTGYPAGSVNRHVFPSYSHTAGKTAMSRGDWASAASQILAQSSYANIGVEATLDVQTRLLTVNVQVYYTGTPGVSTNRIHVALVQNNIEGPQIGAHLNPDQILPNGKYRHDHVLRKMISGLLGKQITASFGSTVNETFTYVVPEDYKGVPVVLQDLEVSAFLSEGLQEVLTGHTVGISFSNFPAVNNAVAMETKIENDVVCGFIATPTLTIQNFGSQPLTSLYIDYSVNGSPVKTLYWTGNIAPIGMEDITLNSIAYFPEDTNTISIITRLPNGNADDDPSNDTIVSDFASATDVTNIVYMELQPDNYGSEITWKLLNSSGAQLYEGGPYTDNNTTLIQQTFNLASGDCYEFIIYDTWGDGLLSGDGLTLYDSENTVIISNLKNYNQEESILFGVDAPQPDSSDVFTGIRDLEFSGDVTVFPNPAKNMFTVEIPLNQNMNTRVELIDILGQTVIELPDVEFGKSQIDVSTLLPGIYFLNAIAGDNRYSEKVVISK